MSQSKRKHMYIDPQVQGALVRRLVFHWVVFMLVAAFVSFCLQYLSDPFRPIADHVKALPWTQGPFLLTLVFLLPIFIVDTIKLSHRFAGPVYRMRNVIRQIAQGKSPERLKFRHFDFWRGMDTEFNSMLDRLTQGSSETPATVEEQATNNSSE